MDKKFFLIPVFILFLSGVFASSDPLPEQIRVGVVSSPPYLLNENGNLSGVCIELWRLVSDTMNLNYNLVIYENHDSLLKDLRTGKIDLSICPYTATTERLMDFRLTIPFYISNMGIVSRAENHRPILQIFEHIFSWAVIRWLVLVMLIVTVFAFFLWLAERKANSLQFHPGPKGVLDGVW
jgi:ABC-type amino acid transport substrate-binding protein